MSTTETPTFRVDVNLRDVLQQQGSPHRAPEPEDLHVEGGLPEPIYPQRPDWGGWLYEACVRKLRKAGLVPAAIADELRLSDRYVRDVLRTVDQGDLVGQSVAQ